ncbi:hypothetical protein DFQ28_008813 [Apophysomyces sp. BC1034]|nr:hypothetical protein DFQ30_002121 [Apophysomyces sp. BC1015]KAG0179428.1 hypothetical protein DFQ29_002114 [Apophysomyces sp. BC1021]KAG0185760.1 hypothetical protein DFQ28_008813 [Apophysomyces sp. BC1034]
MTDPGRAHSSDLLNIPGRERTIAKLLSEKKDNKNDNTLVQQIPFIPPPEERKTFKLPPMKSDILSRVQAFLPQLQAANEQLEQQDPSELDIEHIDEENGQYIEMNLGLGVYEEKTDKALSSEEDDSDDEIVIPTTSSKPSKDTKPSIELLSEINNSQP